MKQIDSARIARAPFQLPHLTCLGGGKRKTRAAHISHHYSSPQGFINFQNIDINNNRQQPWQAELTAGHRIFKGQFLIGNMIGNGIMVWVFISRYFEMFNANLYSDIMTFYTVLIIFCEYYWLLIDY